MHSTTGHGTSDLLNAATRPATRIYSIPPSRRFITQLGNHTAFFIIPGFLAATLIVGSISLPDSQVWGASAEPPGANVSDNNPPAPPQVQDPAASLVANRIMQFISRLAQPGPAADTDAGYRASYALLQEADRLIPDMPDVVRRMITAAELSGAPPEALTALRRRLLVLDPDDAVNQWFVIHDAIDSLQTADERLAAVQRLLTDGVGQFDSGVLSRLAYQAANLRIEQGRASIAMDLLNQALELDPTNIEAAGLLTLETDRATDKRDVLVDVLMKLVKADPLNQNALQDLITTLKDMGALNAACQVTEVLNVVMQRSGDQISDDQYADYAFMSAATSNVDRGLSLIAERQEAFDQFETTRQQQEWYRAQLAKPENAGKSPQDILAALPAFDHIEVPLSQHLQLTRALLYQLKGDQSGLAQSVASLEKSWSAALDELNKSDTSKLPEATAHAINEQKLQLHIDQSLYRLLFNQHVDQAEEEIRQMAADPNLTGLDLEHLNGFLALRRGDAASAAKSFEPLVDQNGDPTAAVGLALADLALKHNGEAERILTNLSSRDAGSQLGLWARCYVSILQGRPLPIPRIAESAEHRMRDFLDRLAQLVRHPEQWFSLDLKYQPDLSTIQPNQPLTLMISVRNNSPWPVAIGPDRILSSHLAVVPILSSGGSRLRVDVRPIIVDFQRRFFLRSGQTMSMPVRVDQTSLGVVLNDLSTDRISATFQAFIDYTMPNQRQIQANSWSLVRESPEVRIAQPYTYEDFERLLTDLDPRNPATCNVAIATGCAWLTAAMPDQAAASLPNFIHTLKPEQVSQLLEKISNRFVQIWPQLSDESRAWLVYNLPLDRQPSASTAAAPSSSSSSSTASAPTTATSPPPPALPAAPAQSARAAVADDSHAVASSLAPLLAVIQRTPGRYVQIAWLESRTARPDDPVLENCLRSDDPFIRQLATDIKSYLTRPEAAAASKPETDADINGKVESPAAGSPIK